MLKSYWHQWPSILNMKKIQENWPHTKQWLTICLDVVLKVFLLVSWVYACQMHSVESAILLCFVPVCLKHNKTSLIIGKCAFDHFFFIFPFFWLLFGKIMWLIPSKAFQTEIVNPKHRAWIKSLLLCTAPERGSWTTFCRRSKLQKLRRDLAHELMTSSLKSLLNCLFTNSIELFK